MRQDQATLSQVQATLNQVQETLRRVALVPKLSLGASIITLKHLYKVGAALAAFFAANPAPTITSMSGLFKHCS